MFKKVLVPLDGSKCADKALDFAIDLAEKYSAEIVLISVIHVPNMAYVGSSMGYPSALIALKDELTTRHNRVLSEAVTKIKKINSKLKVTTKLLEGRPADTILETAEEGDIDLIVLGHRGLGGIKEFLLGSVSQGIALKTTRPILIVK